MVVCGTPSTVISPPPALLEAVAALPLRPGVYRFLDHNRRILYIGKAKELKKRVGSYFRGPAISPRTDAMLARAGHVEVTVTTTENEALILEANLIKRFQPPYNVLLKDDKSHPYLHLSTDHPYPRLKLMRGARTGKGAFFGPFPSVGAVRETLRWLQRTFPIRRCEESQFKQRQRPCLQHQIKRCHAPCCARISEEAYGAVVRDLSLFLQGRGKELMEQLQQAMWQASDDRAFEEAARLRDRIKAITLVQDQRRVNLVENCHLDLFGVAQDAGGSVVQVFYIRHGINLGNSHFFPENSAGLTPEEVLESFLSQYYTGHDDTAPPLTREAPPGEILVSHTLTHRAWLANALRALRGGPVRLHRPRRGEKYRLLQLALLNAEQALERRNRSRATLAHLTQQLAELLALPSPLRRIEAYDVSHLQGSHPVGSLILFGPDGWQKNGYRRFNLDDPTLRDDTARMARMLSRRFVRLLPTPSTSSPPPHPAQAEQATSPRPDLILLDGGRAQLNAVLNVASAWPNHGLHFCAIAKGENRFAGREQLFLPDRVEPITLSVRSPVLFLLQNIRDEAHRFAIGLHKAQRGRAQTRSPLDRIPGIGPQKKRALLRHFGSLDAVRQATVGNLLAVAGVSEGLAHRIIQSLQKDS